ncbi:MAG TPA: hypothetical protein VFX98_08250 [Longimicrobiaceae bacterium]|nr:hypothetical protein [Longimicrobiaceae bacterium]
MRTLACGALGTAVLMALAGCATAGAGAYAPRHVELRLDPAEWTLARRSGNALVSVAEYVPPGESIERWTRFASVHTFADVRVPYPGARWAMSQCRSLLLASCPTATWTVLRDSDQDALYEWKVAGCPAEPDQHEVGRVMNGRGTWARITFSVKGEMDAATRDAWLQRLSEARIAAATP